ncbi:MAG: TonB-dependent receptor [Bacteroidota bacterium]
MRILLHRLALVAFLVGLTAGVPFAQTGTLTGVVVDGESGETLPGANVLITEIERGAATDLDGAYRIANVPVGTYTVRYSFVGLDTQEVTGVQIAAGETTTINIELKFEDGNELDIVQVTAEAIIERNTEVGLLRLRARAAQVSDAISAESISRSGSSDAADAMERVTGASVQGGRYVFVRGLGDRYANTQLNGAQLPTADPDRRAVQFDLFPSGLLDNIVTLKTFTPDQPGSFSGGLVNISTRSFPEETTFSLSASSGFDTQTQGADGFLTYEGGSTDWLGYDDGTRDLPDAIAALIPEISDDETLILPADIPSRNDFRFDPDGAGQLRDLSRSFATGFSPVTGTAPINQSYSASFGDRFDLSEESAFGFVVGGNYGRSASFYDGGTTARFSGLGTDTRPFTADLVYDDTRGTQEVTWGGIANATLRLGANNEIGVNSLFTRSADEQARFLQGEVTQVGTFFQERVLGYTQRQMASSQLRGRHLFAGLGDIELEWRGSLSGTNLDEPDLRFFSNTVDTLNVGTPNERINYGITGASVPEPLRYFRDLSETLAAGAADLSIPVRSLGATVKLGGAYDRTTREFRERSIRYDIRAGGTELGGTSADSLAAFFERNLGRFTTRELSDGRVRVDFDGTILSDETELANSYNGTLDVAAGYGMVEFPLFERLRVIAGARLETTLLDTQSPFITNQRDAFLADAEAETNPVASDSLLALAGEFGTIDQLDILPALNLVYGVTDDMNLRAAATQTLARPTFREIAPFGARDFGLGEELIGNPFLDRTLITNLDLRWEWFPRAGEIIAISGYYKLLDGPIERAIINANGQTSFRNVAEAEIFGAEIEARGNLDIVSEALSNVSIGLNLTLTQSTISRSQEEIDRGADPERSLQGQSPYLLNLDVAYDSETTTAGLFFNVFGRRLSRVSQVGTPDVFEEPAPTLDFIASQRLIQGWSLKLSAKNLLGADFREVYDLDLDDPGIAATVPPGLTEALFQRYSRPTSFSIGLSFNPQFGGSSAPSVPAPVAQTGGPSGG